MISTDDLKQVPEFADLPEEDLLWLADQFELRTFEPGDQPFRSGDPAEHMMIVFSGSIRIFVPHKTGWRFFGQMGPGVITGLLPYSRMTTFEGRGEVVEPTRAAFMHKDRFPDVLYRLPILGQRLVARMADRVRSVARADQHADKMQALGKLSAGLAHELNNPAAAARRAAAELKVLMDALPGTVGRLVGRGLSPDAVLPVAEACSLAHHEERLSTLEMADREDALLDWLEDRAIENAWELAPQLNEAGITVSHLDAATASVPVDALEDVLAWIQQSTTATRLIGELHAASDRISDLVGSIKTYSHMDRSADKQPVDIEAGLRSTVTMLGHKMKAKNIAIEWAMENDLPAVHGFPGELNQVWTNLIDNAIDAMAAGGQLRLAAGALGPMVEICVEDNGTGIPDDVLPHIFEPFYSTKDVGSGTGMGLDIVHRIVVHQHQGDIKVESEPGKTRFRVHLPAD